nr:ABC transporter ATP-binding protein [uncultured Stomatobaculum sp.]
MCKSKKKTATGRSAPATCKSALYEGNRRNVIFSMLGMAFKASAALGFSVFTQKVIDTISAEHIHSIPYLLFCAAACVGCLIIGALLEYIFWTAFRSRALACYREHVLAQILRKDIGAFRKESSATYTSAVSNDLNRIRMNYLESIPYIAELSFGFVGTVVIMLRYDLKLALIAFAVSSLPVLISSFRMKQIEECEGNMALANSRFLGAFAEVLQGFRSIKSIKAEKAVAEKLLHVNKAASAAFSQREHVEISVAYTASLTGHLAQLVFFFAALFLAKGGEGISIGMIVAFVQLMRNISQLGISMPELMANMKASQKLMQDHDSFLASHQAQGKSAVVTCCDKIEVAHVSVDYGNTQKVLNDISLLLPANGCYAIIGESGSGKSTLLNLLSGSMRDYTGQLRYDGLDISDISNESLFDLISVIQQEVFIFDASIRDNITMFGSYPEEELTGAIQKAGLTELTKQKGLDYLCGENGKLLSGGEKQRIGIARSILRNNKVLLLDEATSALDARTGYQVIDTVQKMEATTRIVVTHDIYPELMERFNCVFVLKDGQLAESGKFGELLAGKGACWSLVNKTTKEA